MKTERYIKSSVIAFLLVGLTSAVAMADNVVYGSNAGASLTNGWINVFVGEYSGYSVTSGISNVFIGQTSGMCVNAKSVVAIGAGASSGQANISSPDGACPTVKTTADKNVSIGYQAGNFLSDGNGNVSIGTNAGYSLYSGMNNVAVGYNAGHDNSAIQNVFFGNGAGESNTTGWCNTFYGNNAGTANTTGYYNTYIGNFAGSTNLIGTDNVCIGDHACEFEKTSTKLYIAPTSTSLPLIYGDFAAAALTINGSLLANSITTVSDERLKKEVHALDSSLEKVRNLSGVSYMMKAAEHPEHGFQKERQLGFIAQEIEPVLPELVQTDSRGYKSLAYDNLVPVLIEAIREQEQASRERSDAVETLKAGIAGIRKQLQRIDKAKPVSHETEMKVSVR